jgi:predicted nuclease of predicted toxin-antitoxin system
MGGAAATARVSGERLLLDEHYSPQLARALRERGHDVVALLENAALVGQPDDVVFAWAATQRRRIVTENIADFRPLQARALDVGSPAADLLLVLTGRFARTPARRHELVDGLHRWLVDAARTARPAEDWLAPPLSS